MDENEQDQTPQTDSNLDEYIGRKPAYSAEIGTAIHAKVDRWKTTIEGNGLSRQWRQNYRLYHNAEPDGTSFGDDAFALSGDQNEMLRVRFNEFRNLLTHILNMTVAQKVALQTKAANSEPESLSQAQLWDGVLDYYLSQWRRSRSQKQLRKAVELCLIMSNGYILVEWDAAKGEPYIDDGAGNMVRKGDLAVKCRSVIDVVFDTNTEDEDELDWVIVRDFMNRYELMARYPDKSDEIKALESKTDVDASGSQWGWDGETDLVPVYKFFHRSSALVPRGRVVYSLSPDCILLDQENPYTDENNEAIIPLLTIRAADGLGSLFGYSPGNDLAPIQTAMNMIWSSILTNEAVNGVGNISVERGSGIAVQTMGGGVNVIEREPGTAPPEALSLSSNQRQSADILGLVRGQGERISAINSAARGEIDSATKAASGRALGLLQAMSVQFHSSLQFSYQQLTQDFGNLVLLIVKRFAQTEQVISIVGEDEAARQVSFTGESFEKVARVVCEPVNPLSRTMAGNKEEAEFLVQQGMVSTPQQYITVRNTGRLEPLFRSEWSLQKLINQENEMLMNGGNPPVLMTDDHEMHVKEHLVLLNSPQARINSSILEVVLGHVQQHKDLASQLMPQEPVDPNQPQESVPTEEPQQNSEEQIVTTPSGQQLPVPSTAVIGDNLAQSGGFAS